jgi:hypothetical protein
MSGLSWDGDLPEFVEQVLLEFVAAGILVAEGTAPPLPAKDKGNGTVLIRWAKRHVSRVKFAAAVQRARTMSTDERGQHLRKAIDGDTDG